MCSWWYNFMRLISLLFALVLRYILVLTCGTTHQDVASACLWTTQWRLWRWALRQSCCQKPWRRPKSWAPHKWTLTHHCGTSMLLPSVVAWPWRLTKYPSSRAVAYRYLEALRADLWLGPLEVSWRWMDPTPACPPLWPKLRRTAQTVCQNHRSHISWRRVKLQLIRLSSQLVHLTQFLNVSFFEWGTINIPRQLCKMTV